MRDHQPITIEEFNGLWKRGDADSTPPDHFSDCENIAYIQGGFRTRDGIDIYPAIPNIVRIYTFNQETGQSLLLLDSGGNIYDTGSPTPTTPILTVAGMTDFGFVSIAGRAFLTPSDGRSGLENEFVYVYEGDGSVARKAAGAGPTTAEGALAAANSGGAGNVEAGYHVFGAVYETVSGFLTNIGPDTLPFVLAPGGQAVNLTNIPTRAGTVITRVHIVATKAINPVFWTGDTEGYEFFFIPGAVVNNGTTTLSVSFFDADLLDSADDLFDLLDEIPASVGLTTYHGRMVSYSEFGGSTVSEPGFGNISLARVSLVGQPEAMNAVDGLLIFPLDGNPITNAQEFRDVLYLFKQTRTNAWSDNGDVPSSWPMTLLDQGIGCSLHGLSSVLDSGGVNVDYLIISSYAGIVLFSGTYIAPELSWKILDFWLTISRSLYNKIRLINDTANKLLYCCLPDGTIMHGNYSNGLTPKDIRWGLWTFPIEVTDITLADVDTLILAADQEL